MGRLGIAFLRLITDGGSWARAGSGGRGARARRARARKRGEEGGAFILTAIDKPVRKYVSIYAWPVCIYICTHDMYLILATAYIVNCIL